MTISFENKILTLLFPDQLGHLEIRELTDLPDASLSLARLYFNGPTLVEKENKADRILAFTLPEDIDPKYFQSYMLSQPLPENQRKVIQGYVSQITPFLDKLGYVFTHTATANKTENSQKKPGKPQHRFSKTYTDVPFYVDHDGATAEVYWLKRQDLVIKKGAKLKQEMPLNKDGSIGFAQKFALTLRQEHAAAIDSDFITTADIHLKSVNEIGHLLYFAGVNSWLILKDQAGQTLDSYTVDK